MDKDGYVPPRNVGAGGRNWKKLTVKHNTDPKARVVAFFTTQGPSLRPTAEDQPWRLELGKIHKQWELCRFFRINMNVALQKVEARQYFCKGNN